MTIPQLIAEQDPENPKVYWVRQCNVSLDDALHAEGLPNLDDGNFVLKAERVAGGWKITVV